MVPGSTTCATVVKGMLVMAGASLKTSVPAEKVKSLAETDCPTFPTDLRGRQKRARMRSVPRLCPCLSRCDEPDQNRSAHNTPMASSFVFLEFLIGELHPRSAGAKPAARIAGATPEAGIAPSHFSGGTGLSHAE